MKRLSVALMLLLSTLITSHATAKEPAKLTLGNVFVSAGFIPDVRNDAGQLAYLVEADGLRAEDPASRFKSAAFPIPGDAAVMKELCDGFRLRHFSLLRGIIMGGPDTDLSDPKVKETARANLIAKFRLGLANEVTRFFTVAQSWPAGETGRDFYGEVAPTIVDNVVYALQQVPEVEEFGIEFLISAEQEHVNSLAKTRFIIRQINARLGKQRAFPVPDLAHMLGLVPQAHWADIMNQLADAGIAGEIRYAHFSVPESRTDQFVEASEKLNLPVKEFCAALARSPHPVVIDVEAFNPQDPVLGLLRERVPAFNSAEPSGWTEGKRFKRFVAGAELLLVNYKMAP